MTEPSLISQLLLSVEVAENRAFYRFMLLMRIYHDVAELAQESPKAARLLKKLDAMLKAANDATEAQVEEIRQAARAKRDSEANERRRGFTVID